jgi:hypothetical protein
MREILRHLAEHVHARMADQDLTLSVGARELQTRGAQRRIVWVAARGTLVPTARKGPIAYPGKPELVIYPLYDVELTATAYFSAPDKLDLLWTRLLTTTRAAFGACAIPGAFDVLTEAEAAGFAQGNFQAMTQEFTFKLLLSEATGKREGGLFVRQTVLLTSNDLTFSLEESIT